MSQLSVQLDPHQAYINQCVDFQLRSITFYHAKSLIKTQFRDDYLQYSDIEYKEDDTKKQTKLRT
jgi:hypothetical protein